MAFFETQARKIAVIALVVMGLFSIWSAAQLPTLKVRYAVDEFLAETDPVVRADQEIRKNFRISERPTLTIVARRTAGWTSAEALSDLSVVHQKFLDHPDVISVISLGQLQTISESKGLFELEPLAKVATTDPDRANQLITSGLTQPSLISRNQEWTTFLVELKSWGHISAPAQDLVKIARETLPNDSVQASGVPLIQNELTGILSSELGSLGLVGLLLSTAGLVFLFKGVMVLVLTALISIICVVTTLGVMAALGLEIGVLSVSLPILLIIQAVSLVLHSVLHFIREYKGLKTEAGAFLSKADEDRLKLKALKASARKLFLPNFLASLTTSIGFLTLVPSAVKAMAQFGWVTSITSMTVWISASLVLYPALLLFAVPKRRTLWSHRARWSLWFTLNPKRTLLFSGLFTAFALANGFKLNTAHRLFDDLNSAPESKQAAQAVDSNLGGLIPVEVQLSRSSGSWLSADQIQRVTNTVKRLKDLDQIVSVVSPSEIVQFAAGADRSESGLIPQTKIDELSSLFELGSTNPLKAYLKNENQDLRLTARMSDQLGDQIEKTLIEIERILKEDYPDVEIKIGGFGAYIHKMNRELSLELIHGLWIALGLIGLLLIPIYRSLTWTIVAVVPNLFPPALLIGLLAWFQIELKPAVAIVFAIALGFAFNNTMYILQSIALLRARNPHQKVTREIVRAAVWKDGQACLIATAILLLGFFGLCLSTFGASQNFGLAMIFSLSAGVFGDLIVLPAFLMLFPGLLSKSPSLFTQHSISKAQS